MVLRFHAINHYFFYFISLLIFSIFAGVKQ